MKLGQIVCVDEILDDFENGSLGQILEKPCVRCTGRIFTSIIIKLGQNVCLGEILDEIENGSCQVKNKVTRSNLRKNLLYALETTLSVLMKSWTSWKMGLVGSKTRSLGQILEKPCVCSRGHIFSLIIMKHSQNVCLDEILDKLKDGSCLVKI